MLLHARAGVLVVAAALVLTACEAPVEGQAATGGVPPPRSVHIHASDLAGACDGNPGANHAGDQGCIPPPLMTPTSPAPVRYRAIEGIQAAIRQRRG